MQSNHITLGNEKLTKQVQKQETKAKYENWLIKMTNLNKNLKTWNKIS